MRYCFFGRSWLNMVLHTPISVSAVVIAVKATIMFRCCRDIILGEYSNASDVMPGYQRRANNSRLLNELSQRRRMNAAYR